LGAGFAEVFAHVAAAVVIAVLRWSSVEASDEREWSLPGPSPTT
jgi:hypothetical protein